MASIVNTLLPFILLGLLFFAPAQAADSAAAFDQANKLYEQGNFAEAAAQYEAILHTGQISATVYFNQGNACFKAGQNGRAIAAYRKGLQLEPRDPNLRFNLDFVRKKATGFETKPLPLWQRGLTGLTLNEWTLLAVCAYWVWFAFLAARQLRPQKSLRAYTLSSAAATLLLAGCLAAAAYERAHRIEAIVIAPNAVIRVGPFEEAQVAFQAPDGSELVILDQQERTVGDKKQTWVQLQSPSKRTGWVQKDQVIVLSQQSPQS